MESHAIILAKHFLFNGFGGVALLWIGCDVIWHITLAKCRNLDERNSNVMKFCDRGILKVIMLVMPGILVYS